MASDGGVAASAGMPYQEASAGRGENWANYALANVKRKYIMQGMDEGRKRVIGIIAGILMSRNLHTADDLFGGPQGSPRTDKMIAASVQWAILIMKKVDLMVGESRTPPS
jgi:hypothetical protein